ncbi:MAG: hypothetical protein K2Y39_17630 [Candidatus Obscuribacterales bacterium]|nr:hypothetical protein [Candidatus Obscuribacterales bacterium]
MANQDSIEVTRPIYFGLFSVAMATLMYEILLTRIFSVTMWYHFAFMAISIAMFGMTVGAIVVYLFPNFFSERKVLKQLTFSSLAFALTIIGSFIFHLFVPFIPAGVQWEQGLRHVAATFIVISIPFVFSGIAVCLALTKFTQKVSKLYAFDLCGAAAGCVLLGALLNCVDGPSAVFFIAGFAAIGAFLFGMPKSGTSALASSGEQKSGARGLAMASLVVAIGLIGFAATNAYLANEQKPILRLKWVHGYIEPTPLFEKWNSFSRVRVAGDPNELHRPYAWGLTEKWPEDRKVSELELMIDAGANTWLTKFDGDQSKVEHLKRDLTNMVHYIRPHSRMLIVGTGGGRDVLSAIIFNQKYIEGVEINNNINFAVNKAFGDYTGHLDRYPNVKFANDEARSYIARSKDKFDIIQISLIDTFAATAAGAFVLTEHSLYTVEAWRSFLDHLEPNGVLTISRWYFKNRPVEMYRLVGLATAALKDQGVENPRKNMVIVAAMKGAQGGRGMDGIGTMLVSKQPFSEQDLNTVGKFAEDNGFEIVLSPRKSIDDNFAKIAEAKDLTPLLASFPVNISPPNDDSPYFFHMLRFKDMFNAALWQNGVMSHNPMAVSVLGWLTITVIFLTSLCIIVPLLWRMKTAPLKGAAPLLLYFGMIGLGFMFVEISQMQRLIVFLGHPVYGLSVVLFTLLLASGLGSFTTNSLSITEKMTSMNSPIARFGVLLVVPVIFGSITPMLIANFSGAETPLRIAIAVALLFPLGLYMGMAFPIGMMMAGGAQKELTPWLWGINGATSVCASVVAVAIALNFGITVTFWCGAACYLLAFLFLLWDFSAKAKNPNLDGISK